MPDEVVQTRFGKFLIAPEDLIGSTTKAGTLWDGPGFLQVIAKEHGRLGERGVTILDVGANIGTFSVWLASRRAWRVVAVEPVPETLRYLKANLDLNQATCADVVIPVETAAYHTTCRMALAAAPDRGNMGGTAVIPNRGGLIQAEPLDTYQHLWGDLLSLIKIDAQGCDFAALLGLEQTLLRHHPVIVFEWEAGLAQAHAHTLEMVGPWVQARGYQAPKAWPCYANNYLVLPEGR